jgi:hypothetical protein
LDQEARAGWTLVEKFDNRRIRRKRPVSARSGDGALDFDPYRTYVGPSEVTFALMLAALTFGILLLTFAVLPS